MQFINVTEENYAIYAQCPILQAWVKFNPSMV